MPTARKRLLELAVEILVGLALVSAVILYAEIGPFAWMHSVRWWGLAGNTALLVWVTVKGIRKSWTLLLAGALLSTSVPALAHSLMEKKYASAEDDAELGLSEAAASPVGARQKARTSPRMAAGSSFALVI